MWEAEQMKTILGSCIIDDGSEEEARSESMNFISNFAINWEHKSASRKLFVWKIGKV